MRNSSPAIRLSDSFVAAVLDQQRVCGVQHEIYRYPARFSPSFARETILSFTAPGDMVLDPFCGGGTSMTEAIALGRRAAGFDINSLATFLSYTKTTPLSVHDAHEITRWTTQLRKNIATDIAATPETEHRSTRHLNQTSRKFFGRILAHLSTLPTKRQQRFVRLVLLSIGQSALDCKAEDSTFEQLLTSFERRLATAVCEFRAFWSNAAVSNGVPRCRLSRYRRILNRSSSECHLDRRIPSEWLPAQLVLTSPPYPGVHVLYHRWQVCGRRETPAPYWIANQKDGAGESHYTFGFRRQAGLGTYFATLLSTFSGIRALVGPHSLVVQLVGFSQPESQLPLYLRKMNEAGFKEVLPKCDRNALYRGRLWRNVPSRRWYADRTMNSSREVLLIHRPT